MQNIESGYMHASRRNITRYVLLGLLEMSCMWGLHTTEHVQLQEQQFLHCRGKFDGWVYNFTWKHLNLQLFALWTTKFYTFVPNRPCIFTSAFPPTSLNYLFSENSYHFLLNTYSHGTTSLIHRPPPQIFVTCSTKLIDCLTLPLKMQITAV